MLVSFLRQLNVIFLMEKFEEGKLAEGGAELNVEINGLKEKKLSA